MKKLECVLFNQHVAKHYNTLLHLMSDYFDEICADCPEENPKKYMPKIIANIGDGIKAYTFWAELYFLEDEPAGFAIAQIDTRENPMCKREGWGFIREFYTVPAFRRRGIGRQMCRRIEMLLRQNGARQIYLTASKKDGVPFWKAMGYTDSGNVDVKNGNRIFEKTLIESI